jgi:hypothetical protein
MEQRGVAGRTRGMRFEDREWSTEALGVAVGTSLRAPEATP